MAFRHGGVRYTTISLHLRPVRAQAQADAGDLAAIDDPPLVEKILAHLGLPTERPVIAPARSPPQLEFDDDFGDSDFGDAEFDVN